ncbi:tautomerase family protein [Denitromonas iodatirespirans]|uniref:Tautomerase family protein n=1 Tax=Denitromonas iodatirespirans TaxID=2795389 RepID=A0A944H6E1_DENI1|nr:tautomerase family protein [Denitromonas iodatirespirans]MBT0960084.1 tautomerase family protein [Denitromonas iodatirespirans]
MLLGGTELASEQTRPRQSTSVVMPSTLIEVRRSYTLEQEARIIEAVHSALIEGFKIPQGDRCIRLVTHEPHRFVVPEDKRQPELYTLVTISAFSGRSLEAKRRLYQSLIRHLAGVGIPADHIKIMLNEIPGENWGLAGGKPGSEIDLGYNVEI